MWGFVHILYLIAWGNRLGTLYAWLRSLTLSSIRGYRCHHCDSYPAIRPCGGQIRAACTPNLVTYGRWGSWGG
jgi:hypothetical protein